MNQPFFPEIITGLPEADIPFQGVRGWLSQGRDHQIVFFEIEPIGEVSAHRHGAQWGVVFEGEMELTIDDETNIYGTEGGIIIISRTEYCIRLSLPERPG